MYLPKPLVFYTRKCNFKAIIFYENMTHKKYDEAFKITQKKNNSRLTQFRKALVILIDSENHLLTFTLGITVC